MSDGSIFYDQKKFRIGGICACLPPMFIGVWLSIYPLLGSFNTDEFYWFAALPMAFCFIFVAPLVAVICISHLKERSPITREDILTICFTKTSLANLWAALIFNSLILIISLILGQSNEGDWEYFATTVSVVSLIQLCLYLFITLPLSFLCAIIFELVVQPKKNK